jgi:hypothetical protein
VVRNDDIAGDTVINFWCDVWLGSGALSCVVNWQTSCPVSFSQVGEPSEAGTEMVPSSSSLGMPASPS